MSRAITAAEASIVEWLLAHPGPSEPVDPPAISPADLRVVAACECGCCSIDFEADRKGAQPIRDACTRFDDGLQGGVILWGRGNAVVALEFYDGDVGTSRRLPALSELRTWEQVGDALAQ